MGERLVRNEEVAGSSPVPSTIFLSPVGLCIQSGMHVGNLHNHPGESLILFRSILC